MKIVIYIYPGLTVLDAIGPYEVLRNVEGVEILFVAKKSGKIKADSHMLQLVANYSIKEVHKADVLVIPGSTIGFLREAKDKKVLEWIKKIDRTTQKTVTVCTGSIILAATGLLAGLQATSHWKPIKMLEEYGAVPVNERFIEQGKYITAAGVSAGIDMALYLVNLLKGATAAKAAQLAIEYDPQNMFQSGNVMDASEEVIALAEKRMEEDARKDLSLWQKIRHVRTLRKLQKK